MRENWVKMMVLATALLALTLAAVFARMQNDTDEASAKITARLWAEMVQETNSIDIARMIAGQQLFAAHSCTGCHSIAGKGNPGRPLDGIGKKYSTEELRDWIIGAEKLKSKLPAYAYNAKQVYVKLPEDDMEALIFYLQSNE